MKRLLWASVPYLLMAAVSHSAWAQAQDDAGRTRFRVVSPPSIVGFDARATVAGSFAGETNEVSGDIFVDLSALAKGVRATIRANAAALRTGIGLRDSDLQVVMETGRHPEIRFTLTGIESPKPGLRPGDQLEVVVTGTMEIHGVQRAVQLPVTVTVGPQGIEVRGRTALRMTDYGMRPPRVFFVVSVEDEVQARFTLVAEPGR